MKHLDEIDRKLLAELRLDSRASITTLAARLGLARGTVQHRLTRLTESKTIKRFTIELDKADPEDMVFATMMIAIEGNTATSVQKALQRMPEVIRLHRTCGVWDMVIQLETPSLQSFDNILNRIRSLSGVKNSETCPLLRRVI